MFNPGGIGRAHWLQTRAIAEQRECQEVASSQNVCKTGEGFITDSTYYCPGLPRAAQTLAIDKGARVVDALSFQQWDHKAHSKAAQRVAARHCCLCKRFDQKGCATGDTCGAHARSQMTFFCEVADHRGGTAAVPSSAYAKEAQKGVAIWLAWHSSSLRWEFKLS